MKRQMEMFILYQCPRCFLPTDYKEGPCDSCSGQSPSRPTFPTHHRERAMIEGGWAWRVGSAAVGAFAIGGALVVGAALLWWTSR